MYDYSALKGKRNLVIGGSGFKGTWLKLVLDFHGIEFKSASLSEVSEPSLNTICFSNTQEIHLDVTDGKRIHSVLEEVEPDVIFYFAAQALVKKSIEDPIDTFETNVMGMVKFLDCIRNWGANRNLTLILITSDKVYKNNGWYYGYREIDALGGEDPYSASKSMAELAIDCYFDCYLKTMSFSGLQISVARAGNVIGGGDFAPDRIVPDCFRAWKAKQPVSIRSAGATRPWQHVLEPISGYLRLGSYLIEGANQLELQKFNFGPSTNSEMKVLALVQRLAKKLTGLDIDVEDPTSDSIEAHFLKLSSEKAQAQLNWSAKWDFETTIDRTGEWYFCFGSKEARTSSKRADIRAMTYNQIEDYFG